MIPQLFSYGRFVLLFTIWLKYAAHHCHYGASILWVRKRTVFHISVF